MLKLLVALDVVRPTLSAGGSIISFEVASGAQAPEKYKSGPFYQLNCKAEKQHRAKISDISNHSEVS